MCVCQFVIYELMWVWLCVCKCEYLQVPVEVKAKSQKSSIPAACCSLLSVLSSPVAMAAAVKAVSMAKRGSWHPPITDLPPPPICLSPPARILTRWWTCLGVGGQWLRAAEWQWGMMRERMRKRGVTPYRWGGEMRKWKDETKIWLLSRDGAAWVAIWENGSCFTQCL